MIINPNKWNVQSSEEKIGEDISVSKKKLTRKEKKSESLNFIRNRPLVKFEVSKKDRQVKYKRNGRKNDKSLKKYNLNYRTFPKAESIFNKWLKENIHRFNYKPIRLGDDHNFYSYNFEGVIKNIELNFELYGPEVSLVFTYFGKDNTEEESSQCFDVIDLEYVMQECFHPQKGFYDSDNVTGNFNYYPTREALYINQVFEVAIKRCNEMLVPENSLYLKDSCGMTDAYIGTSDESNKDSKRTYQDPNASKIVDLSPKECFELLKENKVYRIIKYDLFQLDKEPLQRYYWNKKNG